MSSERGTWDKDTECRFVRGHTVKAFAGLFFYHGFGMGYFYHPDGTKHWLSTTQAADAAREAGVKFRNVDSFSDYVPTALGDRWA